MPAGFSLKKYLISKSAAVQKIGRDVGRIGLGDNDVAILHLLH